MATTDPGNTTPHEHGKKMNDPGKHGKTAHEPGSVRSTRKKSSYYTYNRHLTTCKEQKNDMQGASNFCAPFQPAIGLCKGTGTKSDEGRWFVNWGPDPERTRVPRVGSPVVS